jgi:hypothetical protein
MLPPVPRPAVPVPAPYLLVVPGQGRRRAGGFDVGARGNWHGVIVRGSLTPKRPGKPFSTRSALNFSKTWTKGLGEMSLNSCKTPIFSRTWIVQEIGLAQNVSLNCGRRSINWKVVMVVAWFLSTKAELPRLHSCLHSRDVVHCKRRLYFCPRSRRGGPLPCYGS